MITKYQDLFDYLSNELNVIATEIQLRKELNYLTNSNKNPSEMQKPALKRDIILFLTQI
jgi:hypothetical protein